MSVSIKIDLSRLEAHLKHLDATTMAGIDRGMADLASEAKTTATTLINQQIYDTPERGYERTGALRDSIHSGVERTGESAWELSIGAVGGAGGREYALYNERGTYGGRVTLESIQRRALQTEGFIRLQYGDPKSGLEPRPWTIPTMVMMSRRFLDVIRKAVKQAEAQWR